MSQGADCYSWPREYARRLEPEYPDYKSDRIEVLLNRVETLLEKLEQPSEILVTGSEALSTYMKIVSKTNQGR